jgi:hypothetical protein
METIPFIVASKKKYLEINLMKEVKDFYNKHYKSLEKDIERHQKME